MVSIIKKGATKKEIKILQQNLNKNTSSGKKFDANKFCGLIKFKDDGLEIQKNMRDEW